MRHRAACHDAEDVQQVLAAGTDACGFRERHQHVEHGVKKHRDGQQEAASEKRDGRSRRAKHAQRGSDDAIGPAAFEQRGPDDRGHRDEQSDLPARASESFADAFASGCACERSGVGRREPAGACRLFDDAGRGQQGDEQGSAQQCEERVDAQEQDPADDQSEREQKEEQDEHGPSCSGDAAGLSRTIKGTKA